MEAPAATDGPPSVRHATTAATAAGPLAAPLFEAMLQRLKQWQDLYYTTIVPGSAHDARDLAHWLAAVRSHQRRGTLPAAAAGQLNALGTLWEVDVLTSKWHSNFHAAREFREAHGGAACDIDTALPSDYANADRADWVEAARWLQRQKELYAGQKLRAVRVKLVRQVLGARLERSQGRKRRNLHRVLREEQAAFREQLTARSGEAGREDAVPRTKG